LTDEKLKEVITTFVEGLIRELEKQGKDYCTTTDLRKFIQNMETNTKVIGKKYLSEKVSGL